MKKQPKTYRTAIRLTEEELLKLKMIDNNLSKAMRKCIAQYKETSNVSIN